MTGETRISTQAVGDFLDHLASASPTPGGGTAAAVAGAMSAALAAIFGRLTASREKYAAVEGRMREIIGEAEKARANLVLLAQRDQEAFDRVMEAYGMPKASPEEKERRAEAIQRALKEATRIPLETLEEAAALQELAADALEFGNANARSDAGAAWHLAEAAFQGALLNVRINLEGIKDREFAGTVLGSAEKAERKNGTSRGRIEGLIEKLFGKEERPE